MSELFTELARGGTEGMMGYNRDMELAQEELIQIIKDQQKLIAELERPGNAIPPWTVWPTGDQPDSGFMVKTGDVLGMGVTVTVDL